MNEYIDSYKNTDNQHFWTKRTNTENSNSPKPKKLTQYQISKKIKAYLDKLKKLNDEELFFFQNSLVFQFAKQEKKKSIILRMLFLECWLKPVVLILWTIF